MNAIGADVVAIYVKVQSAKDDNGRARTEPKFVILETNSAPAFGTITEQKYIERIPQILQRKHDSMSPSRTRV